MRELKNRRWPQTSEQLMLLYVWTVDFHLTDAFRLRPVLQALADKPFSKKNGPDARNEVLEGIGL